VLGRELQPRARHQERPGDPGRGQPENPLARIERRAHLPGVWLIAHPNISPRAQWSAPRSPPGPEKAQTPNAAPAGLATLTKFGSIRSERPGHNVVSPGPPRIK